MKLIDIRGLSAASELTIGGFAELCQTVKSIKRGLIKEGCLAIICSLTQLMNAELEKLCTYQGEPVISAAELADMHKDLHSKACPQRNGSRSNRSYLVCEPIPFRGSDHGEAFLVMLDAVDTEPNILLVFDKERLSFYVQTADELIREARLQKLID